MHSTKQLEIRLDCRAEARRLAPFRRRQARARWWFDQMRRAVDDAADWHREQPPAAPEPSKRIAA